MAGLRIAALFDAENIDCAIVGEVLQRLRQRGVVQIKTAIGDFSILKPWIECASEHGIELVMQPGLGRGKNSADIKLAIGAMDILHRGHVDAIALISNDRDFTPLAFRLREAGLQVFGFSNREPSVDFRAACNEYVVVGAQVSRLIDVPSQAGPILSSKDIVTLEHIADTACAGDAIHPVSLTKAIIAQAPELATKLSGNGRFLKTLVAHGIVERVGGGAELRVQRRAS